ncbi:MAG TPA: DUF547 domain-containing protein [Fulvivirga sp.]|nr:DUF547 domain-containing protein [Fulvivirga sp.]
MKPVALTSLFLIFVLSCTADVKSRKVADTPPSHAIYDGLLKKYVKGAFIDYEGLKGDSKELQKYLDLLSQNPPNKDTWSPNEQLAYWINTYNAFTLKLIIDNYPVSSIRDLHPTLYVPLVNTVWHKKFFEIGGVPTNLDEIEHSILRKEFNEPRIHFAINCASYSCPPLRAEAFFPQKIDQQLNEQAVQFINDKDRNVISPNKIEISKIFSWFTKDFTKKGSLIDYLNQYSKVKINKDAEIDYMDYDWSLNDTK